MKSLRFCANGTPPADAVCKELNIKFYHKIKAPFKRSDDGKMVVTSVFQSKTLEQLKNINWLGTEKIDGTNTAIYWNGHEFSVHGHSEKSQFSLDAIALLDSIWKTDAMEEKVEEFFGETEAIFYGETYGGKIGAHGKDYGELRFILFDIYFPNTNHYFDFENVRSIGEKLGLNVVKIVAEGTIGELVKVVQTHPTSFESPDMKIEGVVARPAYELLDSNGHRLISKIKWDDVRDLK